MTFGGRGGKDEMAKAGVPMRRTQRVRRARRLRRATPLAAVAMLAALGCVAKQTIPVDAGPQPLALYVDGTLQATVPGEVELRSDRDHTLYFKKEGFRSELVVLESSEADGRDRLQPGTVRVRLQPRGSSGGEVEIEGADSADDPAP